MHLTPRRLTLLFVLLIFSTSCPVVGEMIVAWGDSLTVGTGGTPWTTQFATLSGLTTLNRGVAGNTSTQIASRFQAEPSLFDDFAVIWAGRNNYADAATVRADIASMVSSLTTTHYLILGVVNGNYNGWETIGGTGYTQITALNNSLAATYGSHFMDIRSVLVAHANPLLSQDVIDAAHDLVPASLRSDNVHLNSVGYGVVADAVYGAYLVQVPEPRALWLLGLGLFLYVARRCEISRYLN